MGDGLGVFAQRIFQRTYALTPGEDWGGCARRVAAFVANGDPVLEEKFFRAIYARKFMPGGRYLYSAGRPIPQNTNCFLLRAADNREGWGRLLDRAVQALSTGGGVGVEYSALREKGAPIRRFGGEASGPVSLMAMVNEVARHVMAGGKRRSALWAGLSWRHPDADDFIRVKDWELHVRALKEKDLNFPATLDMTNVSVGLDDEFFTRMAAGDPAARGVYLAACRRMCRTGEPGFSINLGAHAAENLRNPCQPAWATVLTPDGVRTLAEVEEGSVIWSGARWTRVRRKWATGSKPVFAYRTTAGTFYGTEEHRVVQGGAKVEARDAEGVDRSVGPSPAPEPVDPQDVMDGLLLGDGSVHKASKGLVLLYIGADDASYHRSEIRHLIGRRREAFGSSAWEVVSTLTASDLPHTYERSIPARFRRASALGMRGFLRGLYSANGSVVRDRVTLKAASFTVIEAVQEMLSAIGIRSYYTTNAPHEVAFANGTYACRQSYDLNITGDRGLFRRLIGFVQPEKQARLDATCDRPRLAVAPKETFAIVNVAPLGEQDVFDIEVEDAEHTYWTGGLLVSNCCEVTSDTDGDCCNLGSVNLARIESLDELEEVTRLATRFLYLGTFVGWLPHADFQTVREQNRRIGLGIMGLHEWCLTRGLPYGPSPLLGRWLDTWAATSDNEALAVSRSMSTPFPVARRAVAPTGTIGILAETTTSTEPITFVACKRRWLDTGGKWRHTYLVDPTAGRLIEQGVKPGDIEDAHTLARDVERRFAMQAFVQEHVDQAISSTVNLPEWGEPGNNDLQKFADTLLKYLPRLRGITVYPDGARPGQPITAVPYEEAVARGDAVYEESEERCVGGVCGL